MANKKKENIKLPKPRKKSETIPTTEEEWVGYIEDLHGMAVETRRKIEFQNVVNTAYTLGYQNLVFNRATGEIAVPSEYKRPLTINRIGSFVEARHALLTKNRPRPKVFPNTSELKDQRAAKYADQALVYLWRKTDMEAEYDKLVMQMLTCGTSFMRVLWDPKAGDFIMDETKTADGKGLELTDEGEVQFDKVFMGEITSRAVSFFNLLVANHMIHDIKDQPWIMERSFQTKEEIERLYPHLDGEISARLEDAGKTQYERILENLNSPVLSGTPAMKPTQKQDDLNSEILVKTFWMKPNEIYPRGVVAVVTQGKLAMIDQFPFDFGENVYPYVKFQEKEDGFHFWSHATVERLIPIQRAINGLKQQKLKNAQLMANGKWGLAKGSQVNENSLTDEEGEVVEYNSSVPEPHQLAIAPMPNYVTELANGLINDFRDVANQREFSLSPAPQLTAAVALEVAAEQSEQALGPIVRRLARGMQEVAHIQLLLMQENYTDPRRVAIHGEDNQVSVQFMQSSDFRHHTDVHVDTESMVPDLRGAKRQSLFDMWDRRIIMDPTVFKRAYRFGNLDEIIETEEKRDEVVVLGIQQLKLGGEPPISQFDNHMLWVDKLSKFIQTPEFLRLEDDRKAMMVNHLAKRIQVLQGSLPQGPQTQQNQAAVGTEFGPERPPGAPGA